MPSARLSATLVAVATLAAAFGTACGAPGAAVTEGMQAPAARGLPRGLHTHADADPVLCRDLPNILDAAKEGNKTVGGEGEGEGEGCKCRAHWDGPACDLPWSERLGAWWGVKFGAQAAIHAYFLFFVLRSLHYIQVDRPGGILGNLHVAQVQSHLVAFAMILSRTLYVVLYWFAWPLDPENLAKEILFQAGSSLIMILYLQVVLFWVETVRGFESNDIKSKHLSISRRTQLFVVAYGALYPVSTVSLMVVRVLDNKPVFKLLVSGVDALFLFSVIVPYVVFARRLLHALSTITKAPLTQSMKTRNTLSVEKSAAVAVQLRKLRYLTREILRGATLGIVWWVVIVVYAARQDSAEDFCRLKAPLHSHGLDSHSRVLLCTSMTGDQEQLPPVAVVRADLRAPLHGAGHGLHRAADGAPAQEDRRHGDQGDAPRQEGRAAHREERGEHDRVLGQRVRGEGRPRREAGLGRRGRRRLQPGRRVQRHGHQQQRGQRHVGRVDEAEHGGGHLRRLR